MVDSLYGAMGQPAAVAGMRLLVAESARAQGLVTMWESAVMQPQVALLGQILGPPWSKTAGRPAFWCASPGW